MNSSKKNIIILSILFFIFSILLYGKCGNALIDFSRESYIPYQMLTGEKLNQDIFLIYGPFGYLLNNLLYKISLNINILLLEAHIMSYIITITLYMILKKMSTEKIALYFSCFFIVINVFSNSIFAFTMPYSYSTLWAICGIYAVLYSILYKKDKLKYIFLGFIAINKIELFILTFTAVLIYDIISKKITKNYLYCLIFPLLICTTVDFNLYFQNLKYLSTMLHTNSITILYKGMGSYFKAYYFLYNLWNLIIYLIASLISYLVYKRSKIYSFILLAIFFIIAPTYKLFYLAAFISIVLTIINRKRNTNNDYLILIFGLILCSKSIFAISPFLYSNFGWILIIFYIFKQLRHLLDKKWVFCHIILAMFFISTLELINHDGWNKQPLKTTIGTVQLAKNDKELIENVIGYLNKNIKKNEDVVVVPEGQIINLILNKPWKYYNSTFTPMDFETFNENLIIDKLKENKTDYIVFYPRNTKEYGAETICYDYGIDFCAYVMDNYTRVKMFENKQKVLIFKINEK